MPFASNLLICLSWFHREIRSNEKSFIYSLWCSYGIQSHCFKYQFDKRTIKDDRFFLPYLFLIQTKKKKLNGHEFSLNRSTFTKIKSITIIYMIFFMVFLNEYKELTRIATIWFKGGLMTLDNVNWQSKFNWQFESWFDCKICVYWTILNITKNPTFLFWNAYWICFSLNQLGLQVSQTF